MKNSSLITALILFFSVAYGQQNDPLFKTDANGNLYYSEVIEMPSVFTPEILERRAKNFVIKQFRNPDKVLQVDNKEQKVVVGILSYLTKVPMAGTMEVNMRIKLILYFKDNKYKYELLDIYRIVPPSQYSSGGDYRMESYVFTKKKDGSYHQSTANERVAVSNEINEFLSSLKDAMYTRDDFYEPESTKGFEKPKTQVEVKKEENVVTTTTTQPKKEEKPFTTEKPNTPTDANKLAVNAYKKDNGIFFEMSFNAQKVCTQKNSKMKVNFEDNQSLLFTNTAESNCKGNLSTFITDVDKLKKLKITSFQIATDKGFKELTLEDSEKLRLQIENLTK